MIPDSVLIVTAAALFLLLIGIVGARHDRERHAEERRQERLRRWERATSEVASFEAAAERRRRERGLALSGGAA